MQLFLNVPIFDQLYILEEGSIPQIGKSWEAPPPKSAHFKVLIGFQTSWNVEKTCFRQKNKMSVVFDLWRFCFCPTKWQNTWKKFWSMILVKDKIAHGFPYYPHFENTRLTCSQIIRYLIRERYRFNMVINHIYRKIFFYKIIIHTKKFSFKSEFGIIPKLILWKLQVETPIG